MRLKLALSRAWFWTSLCFLLLLLLSLFYAQTIFDTENGTLLELSTTASCLYLATTLLFYLLSGARSWNRRVVVRYVLVFVLGLPLFIALGSYLSFKSALESSSLKLSEMELGILSISYALSVFGLPLLLSALALISPIAVTTANCISESIFGKAKEFLGLVCGGVIFLAAIASIGVATDGCLPGSGQCVATRLVEGEVSLSCATIESADEREKCWGQLAGLASSIEQCQLIPEGIGRSDLLNTRDFCFSQLARKLKTPALCYHVKYGPSQILCNSMVEHQL